jgi:hypothetical protein
MFISIPDRTDERAMLTVNAGRFDARMVHHRISATIPTPRHDNDRKNPRTPKNIYDLNRRMAERMEEIFLSRGIPVVPTIGELFRNTVSCALVGILADLPV